MRTLFVVAMAVGAFAVGSASAFEFRCRWVERVGNVDTVIGGDGATLGISDGSAHRIRLQFGVFDDAAGEAPAGGFLGWNVGSLDVSGDAVNTRTNGRVIPFNFSNQPGANGSPATDPFTSLTDIDATLGTQSPFWGFDPDGNPMPQPPATVRGRNAFVSVYEFTTNPSDVMPVYSIVAGGNLVGATGWAVIGTPIPPNPGDPGPFTITYAPIPIPPVAFDCTLHILVPSPPAGVFLGAASVFALRRRRR